MPDPVKLKTRAQEPTGGKFNPQYDDYSDSKPSETPQPLQAFTYPEKSLLGSFNAMAGLPGNELSSDDLAAQENRYFESNPEKPYGYDYRQGLDDPNASTTQIMDDMRRRQAEVEKGSKITGWRAFAKGLSERLMQMGQNPYSSWQEMLVGIGSAVSDPLISRFANKQGYLERYQRPYDVQNDPIMRALNERLPIQQQKEAQAQAKAKANLEERKVAVDEYKAKTDRGKAEAEVQEKQGRLKLDTQRHMREVIETFSRLGIDTSKLNIDRQNAESNRIKANADAGEVDIKRALLPFQQKDIQSQIDKRYKEIMEGTSPEEAKAIYDEATLEARQMLEAKGINADAQATYMKEGFESLVKAKAADIRLRRKKEQEKK